MWFSAGHVDISVKAAARSIEPRNVVMLTILREPVARMQSMFNFLKDLYYGRFEGMPEERKEDMLRNKLGVCSACVRACVCALVS